MSTQEAAVPDAVENALGADVGLVPVVDDSDTRGWFEAAVEERLTVQQCSACAHQQWPPRPMCRECHGTVLEWVDVPGHGTVHTWTTVTHQINPRFPVPYTVVLVDVEPRPGEAPVRFLGHMAGRPALSVGLPVTVDFVRLDDVVLPNWVLSHAPAPSH